MSEAIASSILRRVSTCAGGLLGRVLAAPDRRLWPNVRSRRRISWCTPCTMSATSLPKRSSSSSAAAGSRIGKLEQQAGNAGLGIAVQQRERGRHA